MITIANPIYDTVFKHLMEDLQVAKAMVSCLLGVKILELKPQPQEVTDFIAPTPAQDGSNVRIFRLDYSAVIRVSKKEKKRVLIELQKASKSEALERFRGYLGKHYLAPAKQQPILPLVAVYLLGFTINAKLPVVTWVRREYIDGITGEELDPEVKEPFIEELTHDSVVVQIPKVSGVAGNTTLETLLKVFDQRHRLTNPHLLEIAEGELENTPKWFQRLVRLLQNAASNEVVRTQMAVEDEALELLQRSEKLSVKLNQALSRTKRAVAETVEERRLKEAALARSEEERRQRNKAEKEIAKLKQQLAKLSKG